MKLKENEDSFFWQIIGPLFVICTFSLSQLDFVLFFVSVFGLFACAKYRFPGFICSIVTLIAVAIMDQLYGTTSHAWKLGIEASYALAFYITAVSSDRHYKLIHSLFAQLKLRDSSLQILEEEFARSQSVTATAQIQALEKVDLLQKQLDEILAEQSSLTILNEVLRKTTAKHIESNEALTLELYENQNRLAQEIAEKERLASLKGDAIANVELQSKLQALIRENEELASLKNLAIANEELNAKYLAVSRVAEQLKWQHEELLKEHFHTKEKVQHLCDQKTRIETELLIKISTLEKAAEALEPIQTLEQKVKDLTQIAILHKQLKSQFEEKNKILHETRSELFIKDTELQTLQIAHKEMAYSLPQELVNELTRLEQDFMCLQEENLELQELVAVLSGPAETKKKVRMNPDQLRLF